ncbi:hypothetical protein [Microcoleus sp. S36b_A4]
MFCQVNQNALASGALDDRPCVYFKQRAGAIVLLMYLGLHE